MKSKIDLLILLLGVGSLLCAWYISHTTTQVTTEFVLCLAVGCTAVITSFLPNTAEPVIDNE